MSKSRFSSPAARDAAWDKCIEAAEKAYEDGRWDDAIMQLSGAGKITEEFSPRDPRPVILLALQAGQHAILLLEGGQYEEAERPYKHVLMIGQKSLGPEHLKVVPTLNRLAS
ncbi:MAG: hypothetical protein ACYTGS_02630, partial [Planctomycetota bacterium]